MKKSDVQDELAWADTVGEHRQPVDGVKGLGQVNGNGIEVDILLYGRSYQLCCILAES